MKKFSLKKITAAVSAAAMIATLGTTAFADTVGNPGSGIEINQITVTQQEDKSVYNVKVDFTSNSDNQIGMTMLTYGKKDNNSLELKSNWSENKFTNQTDMKIIGVDQINPVNKTTGSFEFKVSTDSSSTAYYLAKGTTALIALNGDGAGDTPAVAPFTIYATAQSTATVDVGNVDVEANLNDVGIKTALTIAAQGKTVDLMDADATEHAVAKAGVSLSGAEFSWTQDSTEPTKYTGTAILRNVEGVVVPTEGITVTANATVNKTPVPATGVALYDGKAKTEGSGAFDISIQKSELTSGSEIDKMKEFIASKTAQIEVASTDSNTVKLISDVTLTKDNVITEAEYAADADKYSFNVAIPKEATHTNTNVTIPDSGFTFKVDVTVTEKPAITAIEPKTTLAPTYEYTVSDTDPFTAEKISAKLKEAVAGDTTAVAYTSGTTTGEATLAAFDYAWNVTVNEDGKTATANLVVTGIKTSDISDVYSIGSVTVATVAVTKKEKPAFKYGDPVVDDEINISDVIYAFDHIGEEWDANTSNMACDVVKDEEINISDVIEIFENIGVDLDETGFPKK